MSIIIAGPTSVSEGSTTQYVCSGNYSDGTSVIVSPSWSDNSAYATITSAGLLRVGNVKSDQKVVITAIYGGKADTNSVTIQNVP